MADEDRIQLITLQEIRDDLRFAASEATWDNLLERLIKGVSAAVENYCGRYILARTLTDEKLDGDGTTTLLLRAPVISITSILNGTTSVTSTMYALYASTGNLILTNGMVWCSGAQQVKITYRCGWEFDQLPQDIVEAARYWVIMKFQDIRQDRVGVSSKSFGDETISYVSGMPREVKELLAPYRILI